MYWKLNLNYKVFESYFYSKIWGRIFILFLIVHYYIFSEFNSILGFQVLESFFLLEILSYLITFKY